MANRSRINDFDLATSAFIRAEAGKKKLSQQEIAARAGMHINTFAPYYNGKRSIGLGDFATILEVLGVDGEYAMREIKHILSTGNYAG